MEIKNVVGGGGTKECYTFYRNMDIIDKAVRRLAILQK